MTIYNNELQKPDGLTAKQVSQLVLGELGVEIKTHTIQREIQEGRVDMSPKMMGPQGYFLPKTFDNFMNDFESCIKIMQLNGQGGAKAAADSIVVAKGKNDKDATILS